MKLFCTQAHEDEMRALAYMEGRRDQYKQDKDLIRNQNRRIDMLIQTLQTAIASGKIELWQVPQNQDKTKAVPNLAGNGRMM